MHVAGALLSKCYILLCIFVVVVMLVTLLLLDLLMMCLTQSTVEPTANGAPAPGQHVNVRTMTLLVCFVNIYVGLLHIDNPNYDVRVGFPGSVETQNYVHCHSWNQALPELVPV